MTKYGLGIPETPERLRRELIDAAAAHFNRLSEQDQLDDTWMGQLVEFLATPAVQQRFKELRKEQRAECRKTALSDLGAAMFGDSE